MKEIDEQAAAQKNKYEEAATKRQEMLEASIVETGKQFAQLEQKAEELLTILKPHAGGPAAYAQALNGQLQPRKQHHMPQWSLLHREVLYIRTM